VVRQTIILVFAVVCILYLAASLINLSEVKTKKQNQKIAGSSFVVAPVSLVYYMMIR
jgi:hypothetical protein